LNRYFLLLLCKGSSGSYDFFSRIIDSFSGEY